MGTWKSRGLRGSAFEESINFTNEVYLKKKLALVQKIPTPITPIEIDKEKHQIRLAYFDKKSTVDYIGVVQGIPICFDAKECNTNTFSLRNIHEHQIRFMGDFEGQSGIAFILVHYTHIDETYLIPFEDLRRFYLRMAKGGRKSITYAEMPKIFPVKRSGETLVHYLEALNSHLNAREDAGWEEGSASYRGSRNLERKHGKNEEI